MPTIGPPEDTPEYAHGAWFSALMAAAGNQDIIDAFKKATGVVLPKTRMDMMIDDASDYGEDTAKKFVQWFNENIWGPWSEKSEG